MGYAVKNNGIDWRYVNSVDDLLGDETYSETIPTKPLSYYKMLASNRIKTDFENEISAGFVTLSGIKMDCDLSRIQRLKSAYDLADLSGQTEMQIVVDYYNVSHFNMAMADVLAMILELGAHYQTQFVKKHNLINQIMDESVTTETQVDAIVW